MTYERGTSVTLCELWERQSAKGNQYFSGFLGGLSLALLRDGEREHPTRPGQTVMVWKLVAQERQPRPAAQKAAASPPERDQAAAGASRCLRRPPRVLGPPRRRSAASAARVPRRGRSGCRPRSPPGSGCTATGT
jgi:hypothetical protein